VGGDSGTPGDRTVPDGSRVLRTTHMTVTIDTASRVTGIESEPAAALTEPLIGAAAVGGFRARLAGLDYLDPSSLESAVLDELPTVRLIRGYAQLIELIELTGLSEGTGMAELQAGRGTGSPMVGI